MDMSRLLGGFRSRRSGKPERIAFALGGGGVLGAIQVGYLEALTRAGITPDLIVGTSVGSINGAAIAARPNVEGAECLRDTWMALTREDLFPGNRLARAWKAISKGDHLYGNDGIRRLVEMLPVRTFEDLHIPLDVCAANLRDGSEHWFSGGQLEPAIVASTAIPGVYPPVRVDGELFVDGGVVNNVPISRAVELGATTVYVLTCGRATPTTERIQRPLDVLLQSFAHSRARRIELDRTRFAEQATIIEMPTVDTTGIGYNDLSQTERLYREAFEASTQMLGATPVSA